MAVFLNNQKIEVFFECEQLIYLESRWIATAFDASKFGKTKKIEI
jgi:hypothetical protein